jgi:hypothetical protein
MVRRNAPLVATAVFTLLFVGLQLFKPAFLYTPDGAIRQFGIGYSSTTVLPMWLVAMVLASLSYAAVLLYGMAPRVQV